MITSAAGGIHLLTLVAGVGSDVTLDIRDRGATLSDCHMVDDFFFRDVLAIADKAHGHHPFALILPQPRRQKFEQKMNGGKRYVTH